MRCSERPGRIVIEWDNGIVLPPTAAMPVNLGLAGVFAGFGNGEKLMIAGGANFPEGYPWENGVKKWWRTLYVLDTLSGGWEVYEDFLAGPVGYGASVQLSNGVLCIGGCDADGWHAGVALMAMDDGAPVWREDFWPQLPCALVGVSAVLLDNTIYVAGGCPGEKAYVLLALDVNHRQAGWRRLPVCPGVSGEYSLLTAQAGRVVALSKRMYYTEWVPEVATDGYAFDPAGERWEKLGGDFPGPAGTAIPWGEDRVVFLGAADKRLPTDPRHPGFSCEVVVYNIRTGEFEEKAECPYIIAVTTAIALAGDKFYITSGESRPGVRSPHILKGTVRKQ